MTCPTYKAHVYTGELHGAFGCIAPVRYMGRPTALRSILPSWWVLVNEEQLCLQAQTGPDVPEAALNP